ncbi:transcription factor bHLH95-like, partial [Carica papaya]|uniref:transcription factor bHLH95-like n=1 Tax=Carica papaya TaxID=3649 RepID=UPI000B8D177B
MEKDDWDVSGFLWETENQLWDFFNFDFSAVETQIKYPMDPPPPPPPPPCFTSNLSLNPPTVPSPDLDQPQTAAPAAAAAALEKEKGKKVIGVDEKKEKEKGKKEGKTEANHESHLWTERERRKKMKNMFDNLHGLMLTNPRGMMRHVPQKADKITIVDEAVTWIKGLQQDVQKLEARKELEKRKRESQDPITAHKLAMDSTQPTLIDQPSYGNNNNNNNIVPEFTNPTPVGFKVWFSENLNLNICGDEAQISLCSVKKQGLFTAICSVLEKHKLELLSASVPSDSNRRMTMMQVS